MRVLFIKPRFELIVLRQIVFFRQILRHERSPLRI